MKLLYNAAWYLYEVGDYDICLRVVETAWLACEDKRSLQYAALCNVAGCAYSELNKQGDCRKYWEDCSEIQNTLLPDDNIEVRSKSGLFPFPTTNQYASVRPPTTIWEILSAQRET